MEVDDGVEVGGGGGESEPDGTRTSNPESRNRRSNSSPKASPSISIFWEGEDETTSSPETELSSADNDESNARANSDSNSSIELTRLLVFWFSISTATSETTLNPLVPDITNPIFPTQNMPKQNNFLVFVIDVQSSQYQRISSGELTPIIPKPDDITIETQRTNTNLDRLNSASFGLTNRKPESSCPRFQCPWNKLDSSYK